MRALSLGFAVMGLGFALSGCVYYPDGPAAAYGPDWCNYHPRRCAAMYGPNGPPPPGYAGPPPGYAGPPPGYEGPPPGYGPPPPGYPPPEQSAAPQGQPSPQQQAQLAKVNDPTWCNSHPRKCEALRERFGMAPPGNGPEPQQGYGPPPANGAPTPLNNNGSQGSPPGQ
jgi:hypothetical protein